jgi:hypothetical protein
VFIAIQKPNLIIMKKNIVLGLLLLMSVSLFAQKVKFKKGDIIVDGALWGNCETEIFGAKYTFSTPAGEEFVTITFDGVKTGEYNNGKEVEDKFIRVTFLGIGVPSFETEANTRKQIVQWLIKTNVIQDGEFHPENVQVFIEKYQHDVSGRYQNNTTIIINN